jgi:hypothetical protein
VLLSFADPPADSRIAALRDVLDTPVSAASYTSGPGVWKTFPEKRLRPATLGHWMQTTLPTELIEISSADIKGNNDNHCLLARTAAPATITALGNDKPFPTTHVEPSKRPPLQTPSSSPLPALFPFRSIGREHRRTENTYHDQRQSALEKEEEEGDDSRFESDTRTQCLALLYFARMREGRSYLSSKTIVAGLRTTHRMIRTGER